MKIVLAYSGGLDTSVLLSWIKETYGNAEMICFCANIGQEDELKGLEKKAKKTGASKIYIDDLQDEFARDFIYPMLRAGAIYEGQYFLGTSIARPLIAKRMVEIAKAEKADAIAHGATGKGNDQVRFELTAAALAPGLQIIAPWRDERYRKDFPGRQAMIDYCAAKGIPVQASAKKPYSMDRNLLHISYEAGILEDPWYDAGDLKNRDYFTTLSVLPEDAPDKPEFVTLDFVKGDCVAVNGKQLSPLQVMRTLNKLGGKHGVGRVDMVENRFVGMKSRGVYETPGGSILHFAHRQIESLTMDREVMHLRDSLIPKYAELVYYGFWFAPERLALQALVEESQKNVTGTVRVKLYKGGLHVAGRKSQFSLYNPHIATMEADPTKAYNQDDATGFIRLNGLRLRVNSTVNGAKNLAKLS
ncbi:MAG: argininosuccinate synthase [Limisphaerales bacterium]|nr:MAG: argininosuccinate synthase [Limisphaerales bacterium]KAG0507706.1 MAG: argininosuccinate synthase [Limisphaerales bacterium]TXT52422.1 MAG: argininosuccinate synthase [Limisphaerales bacterium]